MMNASQLQILESFYIPTICLSGVCCALFAALTAWFVVFSIFELGSQSPAGGSSASRTLSIGQKQPSNKKSLFTATNGLLLLFYVSGIVYCASLTAYNVDGSNAIALSLVGASEALVSLAYLRFSFLRSRDIIRAHAPKNVAKVFEHLLNLETLFIALSGCLQLYGFFSDPTKIAGILAKFSIIIAGLGEFAMDAYLTIAFVKQLAEFPSLRNSASSIQATDTKQLNIIARFGLVSCMLLLLSFASYAVGVIPYALYTIDEFSVPLLITALIFWILKDIFLVLIGFSFACMKYSLHKISNTQRTPLHAPELSFTNSAHKKNCNSLRGA